ncbi:MAG TPA: citrate synthase family protein [Herpetosiphonaceae bacterium]
MADPRYLTAQEAAAELEISVATLYAYVSRGLIRSELEGGRRQRRYLAEDVRKLRQRKEQRRDPAKAVGQALHWGAPLLDSAITLITDDRLFYRGWDALNLAQTRSVEEVAALIWTGDFAAAAELFDPPPELPELPNLPELPPMERFQILLPQVAAGDLAAYDLRPETVMRAGVRIMRLLAAAAGSPAPGWLPGEGLAASLCRAWAPGHPAARELISLALILSADHELNVSSFTARCVASAGATPYAVVIAGLAALTGAKHGRETDRVESLLREIGQPERARAVIGERLRRGDYVPGFGHPLYPGGDPRGRLMLERVAACCPDAPAVALAAALTGAIGELLGKQPTLDVGLAVIGRALGLPPGAPLGLFALGRSIGWIGHALEQYAADQMIRPRARYVGPPPGEAR